MTVECCNWFSSQRTKESCAEGSKSLGQQPLSGPVIAPNLAAFSDAPNVVNNNSLVSLMQEVDELSVVKHTLTAVILSDVDFKTVCDGESVISGASSMASPLSHFLKLTDLTDQHFLLHPACSDLFACLQHLHSHKKASICCCCPA